jgi:uncharacterized Zn finger protein (UPF0148 family)
MKQCSTCGNEIQEKTTVCPFCDGVQESMPTRERKTTERVDTVKLKQNNPMVSEAMARLATELSAARKKGVKVLRVIHGYGSSGEGGAIKLALHRQLEAMKAKDQIRSYVTGEQHNEFAGSRNYLLNKYPELKEDWIGDRGNPGITFVEL